MLLMLGSAGRRIDRLRVVADDTDVLERFRQLLQDDVLGVVGVPGTIDQDIAEFMLVLVDIRELLDEDVHISQQIVEIHSPRRFEAAFHIELEQQSHLRFPGAVIIGDEIRVLMILHPEERLFFIPICGSKTTIGFW